jgi:ribonuclease R
LAKSKGKRTGANGLPDRSAIAELLAGSDEALPTREIARAFALKGVQRAALRDTLKTMQAAGEIERVQGRRWRLASALPAVCVLEVTGVDDEGMLRVRPANLAPDAPLPEIEVLPAPRTMPAPGPGDRFVARLTARGANHYAAKPLRPAESRAETVVGLYRRGAEGARVEPLERGRREDFLVAHADNVAAEDGDLVVVELMPARRLGLAQVRIVENIGDAEAPDAINRIAIHRAGIPDHFPDAVVAAAEAAAAPVLGDRTDLRALPLVTIDGADARDFDDAVFAEPDDDPQNRGGWHIVVAIADVANYVRPASPLDREAYRRGNSVYFPDRVVPMLPEALSNGLCSLRPDEDRACLAADLSIDAQGQLRRHRFRRALMRSAARLVYEDVQAAFEAGQDPVAPGHLAGLYGAYAVLAEARRHRGALEIELPERRVVLDEDGNVASIAPVARLDSHRLIEEFMIAANVAAARELQRLGQPVMFRIHDEPDPQKLDDLRDVLEGFGINLARGGAIRPRDFNAIFARVRGAPHERTIHEIVLRAQAQAQYSPDNIGHFGLGLHDYAHFTSPIRRYADLLVHRALIRGLKLGDGGLDAAEAERFEEIGEHISTTERRAVLAERDANDRYTAAFLSSRIGESFSGTVRGVNRAGLFVAIDENGAEGFVPASRLPGGRPRFDERRQVLETGGGPAWRLGDPVEVRIAQADRLSGSAILDLMDAGGGARVVRRSGKPGPRSGRKRRDHRQRRTR